MPAASANRLRQCTDATARTHKMRMLVTSVSPDNGNAGVIAGG
jgi:hypothetical protein